MWVSPIGVIDTHPSATAKMSVPLWDSSIRISPEKGQKPLNSQEKLLETGGAWHLDDNRAD